jgi:hypothetical protein
MVAVHANVRKLTPGQRQRFLASTEGLQTTRAGDRMVWLHELRRLRRELEANCPSAAWIDAAWERSEELPTGWVRCCVCRHEMPPQYIGSSGACYDCRINAMTPEEWSRLPSSPSGIAIRAAAVSGIRIRD